jgi:hypothetical protein
MRALNTIVHVESRKRRVRVRKTSATPASPPFAALSIASTYFDFGAASCSCLSACSYVWDYSPDLDLCCALHNLVHDAGVPQSFQICPIQTAPQQCLLLRLMEACTPWVAASLKRL